MTPRRIPGLIPVLALTLTMLFYWLPGTLANPLWSPARATVNVSMQDNIFVPASINIQAGDTVVWRNDGQVAHTSTSNTGIWDSAIVAPGQSFSRQFNDTGSFPYNCTLHFGMNGTVVVQGAQAQPTPTNTPVSPTATTAPPTATATAVPPTPTATIAPAAPAPTATSAPAVTAPPAAPTATAPSAPAPTPTSPPAVAATPTPTAPPAAQPPAGPASISITSPANCATTSPNPNVTVDIRNVQLSEANIGRGNQPGQGHYAVYVDGQLRQQAAVATVNIANLAPGPHSIRVQLVNNDNTPLSPSVEHTVNIAVPGPGGAVTLPASCLALPRSGDTSFPSWVLLVAGLVIVVGVAVRMMARR